MMITKKIFAAAAVSLALCVSCAPEAKRLIGQGLYNCNGRLETARQRMDKRNYVNALRIFDEIKYQCGGSDVMDTVRYMTAMAHFQLKQYVDARDEFETLYREHPRSPFVEEAHFRIAHMRFLQSNPPFRDQTETREAIRFLNDYIDMFPAGVFIDSARTLFKLSIDKLAEKEYSIARFYRRQREHEAALIYYRSLLSDYPNSKYAHEATVGMAEMLVALGRTQDAQEIMEELDASGFADELKLRINAVRQLLNIAM